MPGHCETAKFEAGLTASIEAAADTGDLSRSTADAITV